MGQLHADLLRNIADAEFGAGQQPLGLLHPFQLYVMHRRHAHEFLEVGNKVVRMQMD
ncbi:hypothetical protein D3C75_1353660 [compost metagenome]